MRLTTKAKRWLVCAAFWLLFLVSNALSRRYPWLDTVWVCAISLAVVATAVNFVLHWLSGNATEMTYRGYPRWFMSFAHDEPEETAEESALSKRRNDAH